MCLCVYIYIIFACTHQLDRTKNFWRKGLEVVWGDPKKLRDSDVLRFQWPSIGKGWERGLLTFSRAMTLTSPKKVSDQQLFEQVLSLPVTNVTIVLGSKDRVVPKKQVMKFLGDQFIDKVRIVEMEGLGHDPFEEDADGFVDRLEQVLTENGKK